MHKNKEELKKSRNWKLIEKVGHYYIYDNLKELESSAFENNLLKFTIALISLKDILDNVLEKFEEAKRDSLKHKELIFTYDTEIYGELDLDRSIFTYPINIYAYYFYDEGSNPPEYSVLNYLLNKIYSIATNLYSILLGEKRLINYFKSTFSHISKNIAELDLASKYFKGMYYRPQTASDPPWLKEVYKNYELLKSLLNISFTIETKSERVDKKAIKLLLWKLYEIYVYFLVKKLILNMGFSQDNSVLLRNSFLANSKLLSVNDNREVDEFKGKPDITLKLNDMLILMECKYTDNLNYISESKFKTMAYIYEYEPFAAFLIFPDLKYNKDTYEKDKNLGTLKNYLNKNRYVKFTFKDNKKLYLIKIDPLCKDENNIQVLEKTINELLTET